MAEPSLRFVHISDTHIHPDPEFRRAEVLYSIAEGARALVAAVNALPFQPDFILHTGDVAYDPIEGAYTLARDILSGLKAPVYYVPGNHDSTEMLQRMIVGTEPVAPYDYEFEVNGVEFVVVDSNQPVAPNMPYSRLTEAQLERLRAICLVRDPRPLVVVTHHNVLPVGAPWWDGYMGMQNGEEFHAALFPARHRLLGVLHGHIHQNTQVIRDGITYISALSAWYQLAGGPDQVETGFDPTALPGFNVIKITGRQMFVRQHTFTV